MSDLYAVDLALDLRASVPDTLLADLRWHLDPGDREVDGMFPVLAERGPAVRIGGVLIGELVQKPGGYGQEPGGWALTVRQEIHAEVLPEFEALVERLAPHSRTVGVVGQVRFYEDDVPELLINDSGTLTKSTCRAA
ncbi:hypothetical protein ABZ840_28140 [Streptomyces sp. NPDC047117]|uniref:hypothetical protein n=1 Tax=unclassified Streptomyces TaxID=2593676 RepID=UPI0033FA7C61